jgi:hypothetical protein
MPRSDWPSLRPSLPLAGEEEGAVDYTRALSPRVMRELRMMGNGWATIPGPAPVRDG